MTTGLTNDFVELTINSMNHFALFVTTKQSAYNFSGPPRRGREKIFFSRFAREPGPLINIFVILTLRSSKVVDLGTNRKCVCDFLLVINIPGSTPTEIMQVSCWERPHPTWILGLFPLDKIIDVVAPRSEDPKLIIRVINFELTQRIRPGYHNVADGQTDRQTDGRTTTCIAR